MMTKTQENPNPYEDIKVLDFSWAGVGSFCANYFAWFGATVVKVENKRRPDITRGAPPYKDNKPSVERSLYFAWTHPAPKYDITINLNNPKGVDVVKKLVQWADVVVESFVAGTMEKWGLGYDELSKLNPELIMMRTCTHGQTGPLAAQPALGFTLSTLSGFNNITGWPDRQSNEVHGAYTDFIAPLFGTAALMAALDNKRRMGKGRLIDLSQHEASLQFISPMLLDAAVNGINPTIHGNDADQAAPHGVYPCKGEERWCAIAVSDDEQWQGFCDAVGQPELATEEKFNSLKNRLLHRTTLDERISAITSKLSAQTLMETLQAAGVPAGLVSNAEDLSRDQQLKHYGFYQDLDHQEMGVCGFYQTPPFRMSGARAKLAAPPLLGEHTAHVCSQFLELKDEEIEALFGDGAFD